MYLTKNLPKLDGNGNRLYFARGIYVSNDGKTIYNLQDSSNYPHYYKPHPDKNGRLYILNQGTRLYVDELVATCYHPKPKDGKAYELIHKDGNLQNNHYKNLEWKPVIEQPYTVNMDPDCNVGTLKVKSDGTVWDGRAQLSASNHLFDSDTNLFVTIAVHVVYKGKRINMDDLMAAARFIHGDKDNMVKPRIFHKDHDPMNYNRDNLEWVEEDSPEYQSYLDAYLNWKRDNNIKINPSKQFPDFMQPK